jgi:hypothetical protein
MSKCCEPIMRSNAITTVDEDRPLSDHEAAIVNWMLRYAVPAGHLLHLAPTVPSLRVVGKCSCGCASIDFAKDGQSGNFHPIADAYGETADGSVGLILWGHGDAITGLEIYETSQASIKKLPELNELVPFPTA